MLFFLVALALSAPRLAAQQPATLAPGVGAASPLAPPALPGTLPGGIPLPGLNAGTQQEIMQRILDAAGGRPPPLPQGPLPAPAVPHGERLPPAAAAAPSLDEPLSHTEAFFAERLGMVLRQFGYDSFRASPTAAQTIGALPDDYLVGRDDELVLALRGRTRTTLNLRVLRDGTVVTPDLPPIPAAGRTLRELRADLEARIARDMPGTEAFLSIGQVRQIAVFIGGEVQRPGTQAMTALASVLDALQIAGGVRKTGSLRAIRVEGPRGARIVDLYAVISGTGGEVDLSLREGERILVPPLGGVIAVAGEVTRPGIYELPAGTLSLPLASLLRLAGEPLRPAGNRFLVQGTDGTGRRSFTELRPGDAVRRGDSILVQPGADVSTNQLRLAGHVTAPVTRALGRQGATLRSLLSDPRLVRADPYPRMGVILRLDRQTRIRSFVPFDLSRALQNQGSVPLAEGDEVIILSNADIAWLASPPVQRALRGEAPAAEACPALTQLAIAARSAPARFAHGRGAGFPDIGAPGCPEVFRDYPARTTALRGQQGARVNAGLQWSNHWLDAGVSFVHGTDLLFRLSARLDPERPPEPTRPPVPVMAARPLAPSADPVGDAKTALRAAGFRPVAVELRGRQAWIAVAGGRQRRLAQAAGRVVRAVQPHLPRDIEMIVLSWRQAGVEVARLTIPRQVLEAAARGDGSAEEAFFAARLDPAGADEFGRQNGGMGFTWGVEPRITTLLGDPSRTLRWQVAAVAGARLEVGHGLAFAGSVSQTLAGNLDGAPPSDSLLPRVRSDIGRYAEEGTTAIPALYAEAIRGLAPDVFGRVTAGYLEPMFAGVSAELLWRPQGRPWGIGVDIAQLRQRDYDQRFGLQDYNVTTGHVSLYGDLPWFNMYGVLRGGRYLAGDWGGTIELGRRFESGIEVGAFATFTDVPFKTFGEGSFDRGIYVRLPLDLFGVESRSVSQATIRGVTRDGGARLVVDNPLWEVTRGGRAADLRQGYAGFTR